MDCGVEFQISAEKSKSFLIACCIGHRNYCACILKIKNKHFHLGSHPKDAAPQPCVAFDSRQVVLSVGTLRAAKLT